MNDLRFFDAHSHLNDIRFDEDRDSVLLEMKEKGVGTITVGTDRVMSQKAIDIALANENIYAAIGLHPTDNDNEIFDEVFFKNLLVEDEALSLEETGEGPKTGRFRSSVVRPQRTNSKIAAIGECGLDYSRVPEEKRESEAKRQKVLFEKHIELAVSFNKPLMIHCRDAHLDTLEVLTSYKKEYGDKLRGNIHFFSEGPEIAKKYFDLDFTISFTGVLTFTHDYDEAVKYAPLDRILAETDAPYVAPVPFRGKRNSPLYVGEVVKKIADIRGEDYEIVRVAMIENPTRVFKIS